MSRPTPTSPAPPENAYFGEVEDDDKDEAEGEASEEGVLEENDKDEASDEENGEGAARPASPATKIRKHVGPASPATQLRKRVDFIICSNNNMKRLATLTSPPMLPSALGESLMMTSHMQMFFRRCHTKVAQA